jgi:large-conductance mechanosensitive channel
MFVKVLNNLKKKQDTTPTAPSQQELLLTEIRDLLKENNNR